MPTLSIRVTDEQKAAIDAAAKAAGYATYADYIRFTVQKALRGEDARTTKGDSVEQACESVLQENTLLKQELTLKDELLKAKNSHIADLQVQVGLLTKLALPPHEEVKKKHWWQRKRT